jgi:DNA (cytosine-5)-methyltransferase 1
MYKVIDLFAGAGGLSFGFEKTGKYEITASFEINKNAQKTYIKNYPNTKVFSDVCSAKYDEILKEFGEIDVVIGGPPCQGFSNANRQKNHAVSQNNMLVKEYVRAVREIKPKAFVMENVGMLKSDVHRFYLRNDEEEMIEKYNIQTTESEIRLLEAKYDPDDFADDIKDIKKVREVLWEEDDYKLLNIIFRQRNNSNKCEVALKKYERKLEKLAEQILSKEYSDQYQCFVDTANAIKIYYTDGGNTKWIIKKIEKTIMIQRMLSKVNELFENKLKIERYKNENGISVFVRSYSVLDYLTHVLGADEHGYNFKSGILCATEFGVPQRRNRFVFMGVKKEIAKEVSLPIGTFKEQEFRTVKDAIADLENVPPTYDVAKDDGIALNNNFVRGCDKIAAK